MKSKAIVFAGLALVVAFVVAVAGQQSAAELYKAGLYEEEVGGDLQKAIGIYQDILKRFPDNRGIGAMAQLHIGLCYEKLGTAEAEKAFQKVLDNYPEQSEAVREARGKLALLLKTRARIQTGDKEFNLRQVWAGSGVSIDGAVSPDGRYLSFTDWETGDLAIRDLAAGTNRRLTNKGPRTQSPEFALFSKWAPDSRRIAYQWYNKNEIFEVRIIDIENPNPRSLYQAQTKEEYPQIFDWSPDGKYIATSYYRMRGPSQGVNIELGQISAEDGSIKVLKPLFKPFSENRGPWGFVFSPDGKYIAYDRVREGELPVQRDIFLLPADGSPEIPLIVHPAYDTVVDWTPGGEGLLFMSDRTGSQDLWFVGVADGKAEGSPQLIKSGLGMMEPMGITSHGQLYYGLPGNANDVYEVGIDPQTGNISTPAKKAVLLYEGHNAYPDYSPDGKLLAYISTSGPSVQPEKFLGILSLETGQIRRLHPDLGWFSYPRWAPDGRAVSVEGEGRDGRKGIYRIDIQSGNVVPIVIIDVGKVIYSHCWSKNAKAMFYSTGDRAGKRGSIFVHNLETGQEDLIAGSPSTAQFIDISPDGKWLALINDDSQRRICIMPTSGGDPRELYRFEQEEGSPLITPAWSADGRYIYFSRLQKPEEQGLVCDLYRVSAESGEAQKINLSMANIRYCTVHPDGQRIAFSSFGANPEQSQVWVMENFLPVDKGKK